jgi:glyoxylase-like metal-dependent hydrolase (beta-lactamase superfamily II)
LNPELAFITHYHLDHATLGTHLQAMPAVKLQVPAAERRYLSSRDRIHLKTTARFGLADRWRRFITEQLGFKPCPDCIPYSPGQRWSIGRLRLECIGSPGHSPGHSSFFFPDEGLLVTGDLGLDRFGPWYGWPDCNLALLLDSLLKLRGIPARALLTSHGGIIAENLEQAWLRSLQVVAAREERIRRLLDAGLTVDEVACQGIIYPNRKEAEEPLRDFLKMWERIMIDHHLQLLNDGGIARRLPEVVAIASAADRELPS